MVVAVRIGRNPPRQGCMLKKKLMAEFGESIFGLAECKKKLV